MDDSFQVGHSRKTTRLMKLMHCFVLMYKYFNTNRNKWTYAGLSLSDGRRDKPITLWISWNSFSCILGLRAKRMKAHDRVAVAVSVVENKSYRSTASWRSEKRRKALTKYTYNKLGIVSLMPLVQNLERLTNPMLIYDLFTIKTTRK